MAVLLVHHQTPSWTSVKLNYLKAKIRTGQAPPEASEIQNSYDKATLCLIKGNYIQGESILLGHQDIRYQHSQYVLESAEREPDVTLRIDRIFAFPPQARPDVRVDTVDPTSMTRNTSGPCASRRQDDSVTEILREEEVTVTCLEYTAKQIAFGKKGVVQTYQIVPAHAKDICSDNYTPGVYIPDKLVPTWRIELNFIPRSLLILPLPTHESPIIDVISKSVILPWYNTKYKPKGGLGFEIERQRVRPHQPLNPIFLAKEWPFAPKQFEKTWDYGIYSVPAPIEKPYRLKGFISWQGGVVDENLHFWYRTNPMLDPVSSFKHVGHYQTTDINQNIPQWREDVKLLPSVMVTKCPIDGKKCFWSPNGIRRQEMRVQLIFEDVIMPTLVGDDFEIQTRQAVQSIGRLAADPECDTVGELNIKGKKPDDDKKVTLKIVHHAVTHIRPTNTFLIAAVYEDNSLFLFEVPYGKNFDTIHTTLRPWAKEPLFWGQKLCNIGANIPRKAGLGMVKGRVVQIAWDVREWADPGWEWDVKQEVGERPKVKLYKPAGLALTVLVDGEGNDEDEDEKNLPRMPRVEASGGLPPKGERNGQKEGEIVLVAKEGIGSDAEEAQATPQQVLAGLASDIQREQTEAIEPTIKVKRVKTGELFDNVDITEPDLDSDGGKYSDLEIPKKPRWIVQTIHLYQGNNKNMQGGTWQDARGANWEYRGAKEARSPRHSLASAVRAFKSNPNIGKEWATTTLENAKTFLNWKNTKALEKQKIAAEIAIKTAQGGNWKEGAGFLRYTGHAHVEVHPAEGLGVKLDFGKGAEKVGLTLVKSREEFEVHECSVDYKRAEKHGRQDLVNFSHNESDPAQGIVLGRAMIDCQSELWGLEVGPGAYRPVRAKSPTYVWPDRKIDYDEFDFNFKPSREQSNPREESSRQPRMPTGSNENRIPNEWASPSHLANKDFVYGRERYQYITRHTTQEMVEQRPGKAAAVSADTAEKIIESLIRRREMATNEEFLGKMDDVDSPGWEEQKLK